ncbi:uncharacterized protein TRIADDRAFT_12078, partial [Trichoplax adhaerens]
IQGIAINISCQANGYPIPSIKWFKDGNLINAIHQSSISGGSNLYLTNLTPQDAGNYTCYSENIAGNTSSLVGILIIYTKPVITRSPKSLMITEGSSINLTCQATSNPAPAFVWQKNKQILDSKMFSSSINTSILMLSSVTKEITGNYSCIATNFVGNTTSNDAVVIIHYKTAINNNPTDIAAIEGQNITLYCSGISDPISNVTWFKNNNFVGNNHNYTIVSSVDNLIASSLLIIYGVQLADNGAYQCKFTNPIGSSLSRNATLKIYGSPVIVNTSKSITAMRGTSTEMLCQATGNPQPKFSWLKDGANIAESQFYSHSVDQSVLRLINLTLNDEGNYTCVSSNLAGNTTKTIKITVLAPPTIVETPQSIAVIEGSTIIIQCNGSGNPNPSIIWLKNGIIISNYSISSTISYGYTTSSLVIQNSQKSDGGLYQCRLSNLLG